MKKQTSAFKDFIKLKPKIPYIYLIPGIIILFVIWEIELYFSSTKKIKEFYASEIIGTITDTNKDFKGFLLIETNNNWYNLSIYGACIKKISIGDNIRKDVNSFTIIIIPKGTSEIIEYKCYKNKKFENRSPSMGSRKRRGSSEAFLL